MLSKLTTLREEREEGFTLIELLVVILIIGILAAIAIPAFLNQRKSAVDASVQSDVKNAALQVETLLIKYPQTAHLSNTISGTTATISARETATGPVLGTITTKVSQGTTLVVGGNPFALPNGYVITGKNTGGDKANTTNGFVYYSNNGGLQR